MARGVGVALGAPDGTGGGAGAGGAVLEDVCVYAPAEVVHVAVYPGQLLALEHVLVERR